jgi:hypothetical protein
MGFQNKTYGLNIFVLIYLQIELQLQKYFPTCFVFVYQYVSPIIKIVII